ncbi:MAG: hypothetical protein CVU64_18055, partial [Deltaproteobacteria bacterium HGW-Deltaproteobacteria-21]
MNPSNSIKRGLLFVTLTTLFILGPVLPSAMGEEDQEPRKSLPERRSEITGRLETLRKQKGTPHAVQAQSDAGRAERT